MRSADASVVHVIGALVAGGAERMVVSLLRSLAGSASVNVVLLVLSHRTDVAGRAMLASLRECGIEVRSGPTVRVGAFTAWWYVQQLRRINPAIVHLHTPNTELMHYLARRLLKGRPLIVRTLHNTQPPADLPSLRAYRENLAEVSIACSHAAREASAGLVSGPIRTISNGVDFSFPPRSGNGRQEKANLNLDPGRFHFLMIGRMTEQKAPDVALAAWALAAMGNKQAQLHLIGDGALRPALQAMSSNDKSVQFHGIRSDVHDWLLACDCFLMPSRNEGLPIAGIEACGAGLPCVFSDIRPLRELEPPAALWFEVDDVGGLAGQLTKAREAPPIASAADVARLRSRYSIQNTATQYADLYAGILAQHTGEVPSASNG